MGFVQVLSAFAVFLCFYGSFQVLAVGDERQVLEVTVKKNGYEYGVSFPCQAAQFGSQVRNEGIVSQKIHVAQYSTCPEGSHARYPGGFVMNQHLHGCYFVHEAYAAQVSGAAAAIIINEYYSPETLLMGAPRSYNNEVTIPTCMISKRQGEFLIKYMKNGYGITASLHNGATEIVTVKKENVAIVGYAVSLDGTKTFSNKQYTEIEQSSIDDTYTLIAIEARKQSLSKEGKFSVSVSDTFGSNNNWLCKSSQSGIEANWKSLDFKPAAGKDGWKKPNINAASKGDWILMEEESHLYCRGARYNERIENNGYEYVFVKDRVPFKDADANCAKILGDGAHLASIHSDNENRLVRSLAYTAHSSGVWIGVNDIDQEGQFVWTDKRLLDYTNWARGHPSKTDYDNEYDCVSMRSYDGLWSDGVCKTERPSICKRASDSPDQPSDDKTCLAYFGGNITTPGKPPQSLSGTKYGLCQTSSKRSCCSKQFIDTFISPRYEQLEKRVTSKACLDVLSQFICYSCRDTQSNYLIPPNAKEGRFKMTANICEDTCITVFESCRSESFFTAKTSKEFCEDFNQDVDQYLRFEVKPSSSPECFRIDGLPPYIDTWKPKTPLSPTNQEVRIQFNEQIQLVDGAMEIIAADKAHDDEDEEDAHVHVISIFSSTVRLTKTVWTDDTLVINLERASEECILDRKGKWYIRIPSMTIVDMAGNFYPGNIGHPVEVETTEAFCGNRKSKGSGGGFGKFFLTVSLIGIFGFAGYYVYKKKTESGYRFSDLGDGFRQTPTSFSADPMASSTSSSNNYQPPADIPESNYVRLETDDV
mmetsp:Transcript_13394/g.16236  ORF Transcript_13394/g.16236 Transcript_13394/m.16236 type:complete len:817 (+) Transcript_13394:51-2501(+)